MATVVLQQHLRREHSSMLYRLLHSMRSNLIIPIFHSVIPAIFTLDNLYSPYRNRFCNLGKTKLFIYNQIIFLIFRFEVFPNMGFTNNYVIQTSLETMLIRTGLEGHLKTVHTKLWRPIVLRSIKQADLHFRITSLTKKSSQLQKLC